MSTAARTPKPVSAEALSRLKATAGAGNYLDTPEDIHPYCQPWRDGWPGTSPLVLKPRSTAELAALVKVCAETRTPIVPLSGNTGLTGASQPHDDMSEVILSTERLNAVRAIDLQNDTITVEAGVILAEVQRRSEAVNRFFPLSLGAEGYAGSAAICRPTPAASRCCATAIRERWCSGWKWYWPRERSGTACAACARTTPAMT